MSARRQSWQPYQAVPAAELERACYGERTRHRDRADLTAVPAKSADDGWVDALCDAVLYALVAVVVVLWWPFVRVAARWLLGGN